MAAPHLIAVVEGDTPVRGALERPLRLEGGQDGGVRLRGGFVHAGQLQDTACLLVNVRMPRRSGLEPKRQLATTHCPMPRIFLEGFQSRGSAMLSGLMRRTETPHEGENR
jgi:FixJ family two-component response regulator